MLSKNHYLLLIVGWALASCGNGNHKNRNSQLKSGEPIVATSQAASIKTIAENFASDTAYSILSALLKSEGLLEMLHKPGPFTIFAPLNSAFRKLPPGTLDGMSERKDDLGNVLSYHIVAGALQQDQLADGQELKTVAGEELIVTRRNDQLFVNGVRVIAADLEASNGRIYVIDGVLFPRDQHPAAY